MPIPSFTTPPGGDTAPPLELLDLAAHYIIARSVAVAAKLRIADHLAGEPRSAEELAGLCGAHPRSLYRMLRLLATAGIFASTGDGRFSLTPLGDCLRADHPVSMGSFFRMVDGPRADRADPLPPVHRGGRARLSDAVAVRARHVLSAFQDPVPQHDRWCVGVYMALEHDRSC